MAQPGDVVIMDDLERIVEEGVYRAMLQTRPTLVASIADLVRMGQTPAQIERHTAAKHPHSIISRHVFYVARHLARTGGKV